MPPTGVRAMRCASCCSTSRTWTGCWARMSAAKKRNRSMIASNGHAPKAFRRNAQPHIYVCSKGFRGAAPDKQRAVFAAAEIARKAKWVPLCPACPSYPESLITINTASRADGRRFLPTFNIACCSINRLHFAA